MPSRDVTWVTAWDVKQYVYCPTIVWIRANYGVTEPSTPSMELGAMEAQARRKEDIARMLNLPKPWRFEVRVKDPATGASGVIDIVAGNRRLHVVEVKAYRRTEIEHFIAQTLFYAYLTNKALGPAARAYLVMGNTVKKFTVTENVLRTVERIINAVKKVKSSERPPNVGGGRKCITCWYRRYCPYTT